MRMLRLTVLWNASVTLCAGERRDRCVVMLVESKVDVLTLKNVEQRLLREYLDLPGLSLSAAQAARLLCLDAPTCEVVLNGLGDAQCLAHGVSGAYVREG